MTLQMAVPSTACIPRAGEVGGVCSGRGSCFEFVNGTASTTGGITAFCVCEAGWSALGDFATDPSVDCGINIIARRALWGVCALVNASLCAFSVYKLFKDRAKFSFKRIDTRSFLINVVQSGAVMIVGILQAASVNPAERAVGIDVASTLLFALACSMMGLLYSSLLYQTTMLAFSQARMTVNDEHPLKEHHVRLFNRLSPISSALNQLAAISVLCFLARNPALDQLFGSMHYLSYFVGIAIILAYAQFVIVPLKKQIEAYQKSFPDRDDIKRALHAFKAMVMTSQGNALVNSVVNLIFGAVPILLRKASYQIPIAWCFVALASFELFGKLGSGTGSTSSHPHSGSGGGKVGATTSPLSSTAVRSGSKKYTKQNSYTTEVQAAGSYVDNHPSSFAG